MLSLILCITYCMSMIFLTLCKATWEFFADDTKLYQVCKIHQSVGAKKIVSWGMCNVYVQNFGVWGLSPRKKIKINCLRLNLLAMLKCIALVNDCSIRVYQSSKVEGLTFKRKNTLYWRKNDWWCYDDIYKKKCAMPLQNRVNVIL